MDSMKVVAVRHRTTDAAPFALVSEMGLSNYYVESFDTEAAARKHASTFWCCWCLYRRQPTLSEIATGGVGLGVTRNAIRKYALEELNPLCAGVRFANKPDKPSHFPLIQIPEHRTGTHSHASGAGSASAADAQVAAHRRITFGIIYPAGLGISSSYLCFDKEKPVEKVVAGACSAAGLVLDKGKLAGSPEKLNLFTVDGELIRLDLEVEAHLGSTLYPGALLLLEKGNRVPDERLQAVKQVLGTSAPVTIPAQGRPFATACRRPGSG